MWLRWVFVPMGAAPEPRQHLRLSNEGAEHATHSVTQHTTRPSSITWRSAGLFAVRYGIGAVMVLAGVVALIVIRGEMGAFGFASAIGAGLSVVLLNLLYRLSVSSEREREREEEARRYLDEHGVWPDDEPRRRGHPPVGGSFPKGRCSRSTSSRSAGRHATAECRQPLPRDDEPVLSKQNEIARGRESYFYSTPQAGT